MSEDLREQPIVKLKAVEDEGFLPADFYDVLAHRYFPVLSLTYMASVLGVALKMGGVGGFLYYFLQSPEAYRMGYWMALWVSIPAVIYILMKNAFHMRDAATLWYKATAGVMVLTLLVSFLLFPVSETGSALRSFMVATIPILVVQYYFFVREGLPARMAWSLTVAGITLCVYGLIL
ncbi:MAG TPA: hypothetical protein VGD95_07315 [Micavibrio sp.]